MAEKVLLVDDDANVLASYERQLHGKYDVVTAQGAGVALDLLEASGPVGVVISDLRMPGMSGTDFLARVKDKYPDTVRVMLTGQADLDSAIQAINEGSIFRFITKPCPPELLMGVIDAGLRQYQLEMAERELLEKTLSGSVKLLTDVLALSNPAAFGRAARLRRIVGSLASVMRLGPAWQLELAAMLSQLGLITLSQSVVSRALRGEAMTAEETHSYESHPQAGYNLIANIPRLEEVANTVLYQHKRFDGVGFPEVEMKGRAIPLGARLLNLAIAYDSRISAGRQPSIALIDLKRQAERYDPLALEALAIVVEGEAGYSLRRVRIHVLEPGMLLGEDVWGPQDVFLVSRGQEVTSALKARLLAYSETSPLHQNVRVVVPRAGGSETV